jgi:hypothetical protein
MSFEMAQAQYDAMEPPDDRWICRFCSTRGHDHFWMDKPIEECECCAEYMAEVAESDDADRLIDEARGN